MTAPDAECGQHVDHVIDRAKRTTGTVGGLTESAKVQPDGIAFGGERRPIELDIRRSAMPAWMRMMGRSSRGPARS